MKDNLTGLDFDKLISYEVIGYWPIYKQSLREILKALGAKGDNFIGFDSNDPILDICPMRLHADVMGYGIDEEWITEVDTDNKTYINIFTDKQLSDKELDTYKKERIKAAKEIKNWYDSRQLETSAR